MVAHLVAHFLVFCVHNYASESKNFVKMAIPGKGNLLLSTGAVCVFRMRGRLTAAEWREISFVLHVIGGGDLLLPSGAVCVFKKLGVG